MTLTFIYPQEKQRIEHTCFKKYTNKTSNHPKKDRLEVTIIKIAKAPINAYKKNELEVIVTKTPKTAIKAYEKVMRIIN